MAPRSSTRAPKCETTVENGLITPDGSMSSNLGTAYPKKEELDVESFSNKPQEKFREDSYSYRDPPYEIENFDNDAAERQRRSAAVSVRSSYPPPPEARARSHIPMSPPTMSSTPMEDAQKRGLEILGRDVKKLVDTLDALRRIGLKSVDGQLPELVLVGDQSAGKSSLMSAIAEIKLPSGHGMCTRCPTNIKTSHADRWSCKVSLQMQYCWIPAMDPTMPFPNWLELEEGMNVKEFANIQNPSGLEKVLEWAQIALLNPSRDSSSFVPGTAAHTREVMLRNENPDFKEEALFSPNVIAIEISSPGLPALSFYDLPGLFNNAENGQQYLVEVFTNLTKKYIQHQNALIICTIPMHNDPALSKAKAVISRNQAENRCIGVLTMPDRLQGENISKDYDSILRKKSFVLPHGYFITKQPGPDTNHMMTSSDYHKWAREEEEKWFNTARFWTDGGEWAEFRPRCGTRVLQNYLSDQFAKLIISSIPDLEKQVIRESTEVDKELSQIPEVAQNQNQHIVSQRLFRFKNDVGKIFEPTSLLREEWKGLCSQFQKALAAMRPGCNCAHPSDAPPSIIIDLLDDDGDTSVFQTEFTQDSNKRRAASPETPMKRRRMGYDQDIRLSTPSGSVKSEGSPRLSARQGRSLKQAQLQKFKGDEFGPFYQEYLTSGLKALSLADIQKAIHAKSSNGMPGDIPAVVKKDPVLTSIHAWDEPLKTFLDCTFKMLKGHVHIVLSDVLKNHKDTELYRQSVNHVNKFLRSHEEVLRTRAVQMYHVERSDLFTINDAGFEHNKAEAFDLLRGSRRQHRVTAYLKHQQRTGKGNTEKSTEEVRSKVKDEELDKVLGKDRFERELEVAAYIRGYYTTARLRFVDYVCATMSQGLFEKVRLGFEDLLEKELKTNTGDCEAICQELLSGNDQLVLRRNELRRKKAKLTEFMEVINKLRRSHGFRDEIENESYDQ